MCTKVQGGCDALAHHPGSAALHILILASSLPPHMHLSTLFFPRVFTADSMLYHLCMYL